MWERTAMWCPQRVGHRDGAATRSPTPRSNACRLRKQRHSCRKGASCTGLWHLPPCTRSGPTARDRNLPDLGQAARWRLCTSRRALALSLHDLQWQTQPLQNQRAEVFRGNLELQACRSSVQHSAGARSWVRTQVGLVCSAWLGNDHGLPKVELGNGRRVILPAMLPLAWLSILGWRRPLAALQFLRWSHHETVPIQDFCGPHHQSTETPLSVAACQSPNDCARDPGEALVDHVDCVSPRRPESCGCHPGRGPQSKTPHPHGKRRDALCHVLLGPVTWETMK